MLYYLGMLFARDGWASGELTAHVKTEDNSWSVEQNSGKWNESICNWKCARVVYVFKF